MAQRAVEGKAPVGAARAQVVGRRATLYDPPRQRGDRRMTVPADIIGRRSFTGAVAICLRRYASFAGRAPRSEYWWFALFTILASVVADILDSLFFGARVGLFSDLTWLAVLLPSIAVQVRRLHDIDRTGWWWWIVLVPLLGWILLLVWDCTPGTEGPNRYGDDPLGPDIAAGYVVP
jgi:uncharacterized membrane protein YhaH (DUF805 family)